MTVFELSQNHKYDGTGFRVKGGSVIWESCYFGSNSTKVWVQRFDFIGDKLCIRESYLRPELEVVFLAEPLKP